MNNVPNLSKLEAGLLNNEQIDQLITTNRALRDAVLELKALVHSTIRLGNNNVDTTKPQVPVADAPSEDQVVALANADALRDFQFLETGASEIDEKAALTTTVEQSKADFEHDNEHARRRHERRRQQEILRLKNQVSYKYVSFPSTFYQQEIEHYDRSQRYSAVDPHHWWHRLHHRHDKKLTQGPHVSIASTGEYRDELLDALFDFECTWPEHLLHTLPLRELEHTYGYKLYRVKATARGMRVPGTELIIEVGRFFSDLAQAMKSTRDAEKTSLIKRAYTLAALYQRCLERDVLGALDGSNGRKTKQSLDKIYHVLCALNHVANLPEELPPPSSDLMSSFILDALDGLYLRDAAPRSTRLPQIEDHMHFERKELGFKQLTELGGLKIAWTNLYTQHLRLIRSSKTLLLFWDVSVLGQSPLFSHWPEWMAKPSPTAPDSALNFASYNTNSAGLLEELQRIYRIIFGNPDGRFLERFFRKHFRRPGDDVGITLNDLESIMMGSQRTRVNISRSSARQALKYYLRASIPSSILALRPELDRRKHKGPRQKYNWHITNLLRCKTSGKLVDLLNAGPPYPLDFWMHISYLLELSQSSSLSELEKYSAYPIFGDRLRELKGYMDKQRPKNLRQLFKDRRDTVGYWAFWAVIAVGGLSILLALISIAVSSAQVVAGFRALKPLAASTSAAQDGHMR